jgi:hypothetical protein
MSSTWLGVKASWWRFGASIPEGRGALKFLGMNFFMRERGTSLDKTLSTGRCVEDWCFEMEFQALGA